MCRDNAQKTAQNGADSRADDTDQNAQAQPADQAAENVPAKIIGAEKMLPGAALHKYRRLQLVEKILLGMRIGLKQESEYSDKQNESDIDQRRRHQPFPAQAPA